MIQDLLTLVEPHRPLFGLVFIVALFVAFALERLSGLALVRRGRCCRGGVLRNADAA